MLVKMFIVFVASSCGSKCFDVVDVLNCNGEGLKDLEPIYDGCYNLSVVKFLPLKGNNITRVNFSNLVHQLPHMKLIDLRENPFNCEVTLLVEVLSDCSSSNSTLSIFGAASVFSTASDFPTTSLIFRL